MITSWSSTPGYFLNGVKVGSRPPPSIVVVPPALWGPSVLRLVVPLQLEARG